jgi:hypothetical protein
MWSYVDAWRPSAALLGVEIEGPLTVRVSPGWTLDVPMLVKGFGAPRGTLVLPSSVSWPGRRPELQAAGFTASFFGPYADGETCAVADMIDVLSDWMWCGEEPPPPWLQAPPEA